MKKRVIDYFELGATLYIPIINHNLKDIINGKKFPFLTSIVICLEDSISDNELDKGMKILTSILKDLKIRDLKIFIRPRNIDNLKEILKFENINLIDGFAVPKFDTKNMIDYLKIFIYHNDFYIMPILETKDIFDNQKLKDISRELTPFKNKVLVVRIGGEDILSILDIRRDGEKTLYEIMPLYLVLSQIMMIFKSDGFNISSPVFSNFGKNNIFLDEVKLDIEHSIFNKTTIHPNQVKIINQKYKVTADELRVAKKLIDGTEAVFSDSQKMYEKKTHINWAFNIIKRFKNFGLI